MKASRGWLPATGPMKVPADVNVVRFTGFSGGAFVRTPKGFERAEVRGDYRRYAVREGYRLERCLGEAHRGPPGLNCPLCAPMWGVLAVKIPEDGSVLPENRAKGSGRLATDFEGMARGARVARAAEAIEEALPGFGKAWKAAENRARRARGKPRRFSKALSKTASKPRAAAPRLTDVALRSQLTEKRAAGLVGRRS